ncbi:unannotated protein [freshwater metagenome]|uniref:histidine kinase n=1 Tax=freshwater metagenome TaxID=449393 RepID=A0A6J6YYH6_9ZZZZ
MEQSAEYYRALLDRADGILTILNPDLSWRTSTGRGTLEMGYPQGFDPEGGVFSLLHPDDIEQGFAGLQELVAMGPGATRVGQVRIRAKSGRYVEFEIHGTNLIGLAPIDGVAVQAIDVSALRSAEIELWRSEERYRELVENMMNGVWIIGPDGRTVFANPRMATMLDTPLHDLLERSVYDYVDDEQKNVIAQYLARRQAGLSETYELCLRSANGVPVWVLVSTTPLAADGPFRASASVLTDITALKRVEFELDNARQRAEESSRAKGALLFRMSHEFRTPLNAVMGFAQLLERLVDGAAADYVQRIAKAGTRLVALVGDLDALRLNEVSPASSMGLVTLAASTEQVLAKMLPAARHADVTFLTGEVHGRVTADPVRLEQVLTNLVTNAIGASPVGGVVTISTSVNDGRVRYSVADQGRSLTVAEQERAFEPFADPAVDGRRSSVLLPLIRSAVATLGGATGVECPPTGGSVLWFELPLA